MTEQNWTLKIDKDWLVPLGILAILAVASYAVFTTLHEHHLAQTEEANKPRVCRSQFDGARIKCPEWALSGIL